MINRKKFRVRRGSVWGERLIDELSKFDGEAMDWMDRHTRVLKSDKHSKVGLLELDGQTCYLKYYEGKSWGQRVLFKMGRGRGFSSFDSSLALLKNQISVPQPLSCLLVPRGMMLLTEAIQPARDLKTEWLAGPGSQLKLALMGQAGGALREFHATGYCHGDCKWSNFVWSKRHFYFVDLESVKPASGDILGSKKQLRDIARFVLNAEDLGLSEQEFKPFLLAYLDQSKLSEAALAGAIMPILKRLRSRHEKHYGVRGSRLIGE